MSERLRSHDLEIGTVCLDEIVFIHKVEILRRHTVDRNRFVETDSRLGVDKRGVDRILVIDPDRQPAVRAHRGIGLAVHHTGIGVELHVLGTVLIGLHFGGPVGIRSHGSQNVRVSRDDTAQTDPLRRGLHHHELVVSLHSLVGGTQAVGIARMHEIVDHRVLRIEIERHAQVLTERIEARLGRRRIAFGLGRNGNLSVGEFEEHVVASELLRCRREITDMPPVRGALESRFRLNLGRLDTFRSSLVEQVLFVEQARGAQQGKRQK